MKRTLLTIIIGVISGLCGAYLYGKFLSPTNTETFNFASNTTTNTTPIYGNSNFEKLPSSEDLKLSAFADAAEVSTKSVVYIVTYMNNRYSNRKTWSDLFFGRPSQSNSSGVAVGSGSGVIFTEDGYIVTNNHVIKGADKIEVIYNKRSYNAKLIGVDKSTDIALLKIQKEGLPPIQIASSKAVRVGDWVLAVGNPFNLTSTVTAGIVSAKGRKIGIMNDVFPIESFIQTDAAINPGNSGGALVNLHGDLVGINTAILSKTGSYAGYGFAVPSDIVAKIVNDLKKYGEVQKAFLGAAIKAVDEDIAEELKMKEIQGVAITKIEGGAAEKNKLQVGDVILAIDNFSIDSEAAFDEQLSYYVPGDKIDIKILRNQKYLNKTVVLTNIDGTTNVLNKKVYDAKEIGAKFTALSKLEKSKLGLKTGIRIEEVVKGGLIQEMRLRKGMILVSLNRYPLENPKDFNKILSRIRGRVILEIVKEDGSHRYFSYYF
ncbi:trypsin-like peptidase domain-containing protein [Flammeovirga kamogawensis]|uniref:Trypsin-like peptidase domain-containing protein n=1 Tax=Flammeovirga kamogawensis TaxID=373891 RepID=A0ABX8GUV4_9BACT|nr:trypsin-like peptidase domain-containing protein [Flammeovirga kamogawensis]MBB6459843.1 Do/DeqQ family serine protease [Flammeovirga kamogawensis]QWG07103.1 trypsin-like peptidase domain-containing protein [Flammeovirga kamogawensis]TRX68924.1 trypsin-like serine protease [Flammeovirga kamogawensis]